MTAGLKVTSDTGIFDFTGIEPVSNWQRVLLEKFKEDFGDSL
jgi:hypothetical protein